MQHVSTPPAILDQEKDRSLYICSNFATGETHLLDSWLPRIASLKQEAVPFHTLHSDSLPSILLDVEKHPRLPTLLDPGSETFELWPTWCTFITSDLQISDTFLYIGLSNRESYWLLLHFQHSQHLSLLKEIEQAGQLALSVEPQQRLCVVPFRDPELIIHLDCINQVHTTARYGN